jgi:hypothetical protein
MSENLPTMVIVTSSDCSACRALHSTGDFNRELGDAGPGPTSFLGSKWDAQLFWRLLTGDVNPDKNSRVKFRVMEMEIARMSARSGFSNVLGFTEFNLVATSEDINITRNTNERFQDEKGNDAIMQLIDDTIRGKGIHKQGSFDQLVASKFPQGLFNILYQYPSFIWFSPTQWTMAMRDPTYTPYALIYGLVMTDKDGKWVVTDKDSLDEQRRTPVLMGSFIASNLRSLEGPVVKVVSNGDTKEKSSLVVSHSSTSCGNRTVRIVPLNSKAGYHPIKRN